MDVLPVFERVKTALALKNDAALARALDASPKKLAVWKLRNFVPYDHLITLCRHYKLSLDRILGGEERPSYSLKEAGVSETKSEYGPGFVFVPQMRGEISAGGGLVPDNAVEMKSAFR